MVSISDSIPWITLSIYYVGIHPGFFSSDLLSISGSVF